MASLGFAAISKSCPAALTTKARKTTGDGYIVTPTKSLFDLVTRKGFEAFDCLQGPSVKPAYVPFARHMISFRARGAIEHAPHFVLIVTNSHDGLTPIMFVPAWRVPSLNVTFQASAVCVFHRAFVDEKQHKAAIVAALDKALSAQSDVVDIWRKASGLKMEPAAMARFVSAVVSKHSGGTVDIPMTEVRRVMVEQKAKPTLAGVAGSFLSGYLNSLFNIPTASGNTRRLYAPRAIVRHERPAMGTWFEMVAVLKRAGVALPDLEPFNVSPVERVDGGGRRRSAVAIVTDAASAAA